MTTATLSLGQKTAVLVLLDMCAGVKAAWGEARELLYDLGALDQRDQQPPDDEIIVEVWYQLFDPGSTIDQIYRLLSRHGFLRRRQGEVRLTTLARGLMADESAGRL